MRLILGILLSAVPASSALTASDELMAPVAVKAIVYAGLCRFMVDIVKIQSTTNCNGAFQTRTSKHVNLRWPLIAAFCAYKATKQSIVFLSLLEKRYMKQKLAQASNT
jgi:hypothetical protein